MAKINVLDRHTAELIAAGEVVERPASAIKEMVENSIDAGASAITVEIQNGGNSFMRVTDNGCGIAEDDVKNAFLRHATSKIQNEDDLNNISTLGFRGEALASICSVAKVELLTRTSHSDFGTKYVIHGGEEIEFEQAGCAAGTTIVVRDLFYNTPARRKFLKKDNTESNVVTAMLERMAVSHPEISFKLIRDSKQVMNTPGDSDLRSAVFTVFGKEFADTLIPVEYSLGGISVRGFTCTPTASRKNRSMQFIFLNGRYIRTKTGIAALEQAYKNSIMVGTYPSCVLNITLDPKEVDVNVHPAKVEVRFSDEQSVFNAVYYAVKSALSKDETRVAFEIKSDVAKPAVIHSEQIKMPQYNSVKQTVETSSYIFRNKDGGFEKPSFTDNNSAKRQTYEFSEPQTDKPDNSALLSESGSMPYGKEPQNTSHNDEQIIKPQSGNEAKINEHISFKYVGQAFDTYIIVECDNKLILIDKHAAHERILFEQIRNGAEFEPQVLLSPVNISLSAAEYDAILTNIDRINEAGFDLTDFGMNTIRVRSVPVFLEGEDIKGLVEEMAGRLINKNTDFTPEFLDWLFHNVACRAAIKAGNRSSEAELVALADTVLNDERIRYCPHGRPVAAELTENEIKKRFSRI